MYRSERLAKLLKTPVIMDIIMGQLSPLSAQNLLEAISIDVGTDDHTTSKYTSIFKVIIPNRGWLMRKVREDHVFTIITQDANRLMDLPCHGVIGLDRYWMDGIRMDFGWIGSAWSALLDGLDGLQHIQLDPTDQKGNL